MSIKLYWGLCVAFGVAVLAVSAYMLPMFPAAGAGYSPGYGAPVFAFEMAGTHEDLVKVFGSPDDPQHVERIAAMDRGNRWDYLFMFVYASFLVTFFVAARHESRHRVWFVFGGFGIIAGIADAIENVILLQITADIQTATNLDLLPYPVWTKFLSLMMAGVAAGAYLSTRRSIPWAILGLVAACGGTTVAFAWYSPDQYGWAVGSGLAATWTIQLVYAGTRLFAKTSVSID